MKNPIFRKGFTKKIYRGNCLRQFGQFADLRRGLVKKKVVFLRGVDTPTHNMSNAAI